VPQDGQLVSPTILDSRLLASGRRAWASSHCSPEPDRAIRQHLFVHIRIANTAAKQGLIVARFGSSGLVSCGRYKMAVRWLTKDGYTLANHPLAGPSRSQKIT
jgi:hypothetical protein